VVVQNTSQPSSDDLTQPPAVYARRDDVQIVDVREAYEWEAGRIDHSHHIPLNQLMAAPAPGLDPGRPVVCVCRSGNRSELASVMLRARGFDAHNMQGGLEAWEQAGLPLATPDGGPGRVA
jgi:rhodanese-related sulfurtransferase